MKNIGMKKNINEQREGIWGESLKSLKSLKNLKSLMQIFAESAESANSAKQIFATFATFAMQIFSNLVKTVKTVMQIFAKGEYSAVRVSSVQQPTNIQRISNLSLTVSTVKVAQRSRILSFRSRFTLVALSLCALLLLDAFTSSVWGNTLTLSQSNIVTSGTNKGKVVATTEHVRFTLESEGYSIENGDDGGFLVWKNLKNSAAKKVKLKWEPTVDDDSYSIAVTSITFYAKAYSSSGSGDGKIGFNGGSEFDVYTNSTNASKGWSSQIGGTGTYSTAGDGVVIVLHNTHWSGVHTYNYHIKNYTITYTITPKKPGLVSSRNTVNVTLNSANLSANAPQTVFLPSRFAKSGHFSDILQFQFASNPGDAGHITSDSLFYATDTGTYVLQARYKALTNCHEESGWSNNYTIYVQRLNQTVSWNRPDTIQENIQLGATKTIGATASSGLGITYSSDNTTALSINSTTGVMTANAVGEARITATQAGNAKYNPASTYFDFEVKNQKTPVFTPSGFSEESTKELKVGESVTMTVSNVSDGLAGDFTAVSDGDGVLHFSRVGNTITITAYSEGDVNAVFTQEENDDIFDASATYSFSVTKNAPTITVPSNQTLDVDGEYIASTLAYSNTSKLVPDSGATDHDFYYTISHSLSTSVNKSNVVITFDPETKEIVAQNAGTATITIYQKSVREYSEASNSFTITVNKKVTSLAGSVSPILVDATPQISSYAATNTSAANPSEGTSNDFYYTITNTAFPSPKVVTGCADGHDGDVIGYTPSEHRIIAYNAGTAKLTIAQKETYKYTGDTLELNVTVNKHTTEFHWNEASTPFYYKSDIEGIFSSNVAVDRVASSNPAVAEMEGTTLHIYNVNETTNITFTKEEDYKWTGLEQTYVVTPVANRNALPMTLTRTTDLYPLRTYVYAVEDDNDEEWWHEGNADSENVMWLCGSGEKWVILHFEGIPDKLYYEIREQDNKGNGQYWQVEEGATIEDLHLIAQEERAGNSWSSTYTYQLAPSTRYVRLKYTGNKEPLYRNVRITELNKFELDAANLNFGLQGANYGRQMMTVGFNHANAGRITRAEIIGTDAEYYSVEPEEISGTGRELYGAVALRVYFDNKGTSRAENEPYSAQLRVYDNMEHSQTIDLTGYRNGKSIPMFTFNPNHTAYYVGTTINTPAVSSNKQTALTITSEQANIVEVVDGSLQMKAVGTATIVVSQEETTDYRAHSERYTITTKAMPSLALPFAFTKEKCTAEAKFYGEENGSWNDSENAICLGNGNGWPNGWGVRGFKVEFSGVPDSLSFGYKASRGTVTHDISMGAPYFYVEESPDGDDETWTQVWFKKDNNTTTNFVKVALKPTTQFVRFVYDGNYYAYYNNISITRLDGVKYMMTDDGKYLSRGADYGTSAIVDDFGTPVRVTRYTTDNTNIYTKVQFMDSREYLLESGDNVYTDNSGREEINWIQIPDGTGKVKVQSGNGGGKYITKDGNDKLVLTSTAGDAMLWTAEDYSIHQISIDAKLDQMAKKAAKHDFGDNVNTLAQMRTFLVEEDFDMVAEEIEDVELTEHKSVDADRTSFYSATKSGLRPGLYRLTVQALYRPSKSPIDWENHSKGMEGIVTYVFANGVKYPIKSVFDVASGIPYSGNDTVCGGSYYPVDVTAAGDAFRDPMSYMHDLYVYVKADEGQTTGTLNYGIENASYVPGAWLVYDNFTLARVARKEYVFDGNEGTSTTWGEQANWEYQGEPAASTPGAYSAVTIQHDVEIVGSVSVYSLTIEGEAKVTIAPNGGLTVGKGGVSGVNSSNLKLEASSEGKTGYIRISPEYAGEMPTATVEMFTKAYYNRETSTAVWQCVGVPVEETALMAKNVFTNSYLYNWDENINGWYNKKSKTRLTPFTGYETTQAVNADGLKVIYSGHLVSGHETHKVDLRCSDIDKGYNALANSFAAPIAIANFEAADFENTENTIYILNSGTKAQSDDPGDGVNAAGKFLNIPIGSAVSMASEFGTPLMIPSMQGFWVRARSTNNPTSITFNYDRLVWQAEYDADSNKPLRAPKRNVEDEEEKLGALKVTLFANGEVDHLYMLESEQYNVAFENGYDAHKMMNEGMNIFSVVEDEYLAVDATNSIIGTRVGVRTGEETAYTLVFSHVNSEEDMMLWDTEADERVEIREGGMYTFFAEPNSEITGRFIIIEAEAPEIATGVEDVQGDAKVHKFIKDDKLFILKNGVLYDATGMRVR